LTIPQVNPYTVSNETTQANKELTMRLAKYNKNLRIEGNKVISYTTHVATIKGNDLIVLGYWSQTTSKHINYVANELNLTLVTK